MKNFLFFLWLVICLFSCQQRPFDTPDYTAGKLIYDFDTVPPDTGFPVSPEFIWTEPYQRATHSLKPNEDTFTLDTGYQQLNLPDTAGTDPSLQKIRYFGEPPTSYLKDLIVEVEDTANTEPAFTIYDDTNYYGKFDFGTEIYIRQYDQDEPAWYFTYDEHNGEFTAQNQDTIFLEFEGQRMFFIKSTAEIKSTINTTTIIIKK